MHHTRLEKSLGFHQRVAARHCYALRQLQNIGLGTRRDTDLKICTRYFEISSVVFSVPSKRRILSSAPIGLWSVSCYFSGHREAGKQTTHQYVRLLLRGSLPCGFSVDPPARRYTPRLASSQRQQPSALTEER